MKREIKFRVWDNVDFMSKPFTLQDLVMRRIIFTPECKVMQFTGLTDKNGVDIYEGDVMKRIYTYEVRFDKGRFYLHHKSGYHVNNGFDIDFEVIGNIHEHKHLLK